MLTHKNLRFARKFVLLLFLVVCLVVLPTVRETQPVRANVCCSTCDANYLQCVAACGTNVVCLAACENVYNRCRNQPPCDPNCFAGE